MPSKDAEYDLDDVKITQFLLSAAAGPVKRREYFAAYRAKHRNGRKRCAGPCGQVKPLSEYYGGQGGKQSYCKACDAARSRTPGGSGRQPSFCPECYSLPHRVTGKRCARCGLEFKP